MLKYVTFWPRFWALIVDSILLTGINELLKLINTPTNKVAAMILSLLAINYAYLYSVILHGKYGQTIGKMLCDVKIVDFKTEEKIGYKQAFMRDMVPVFLVNIFYIVSEVMACSTDMSNHSFTTIEYILLLAPGVMFLIWSIFEIVTMLFDSKRRALHDYIAKTVVIRLSD